MIPIKNSFTLSFDSWRTDRKTLATQLEYQVDISSAKKLKSPNYLIVAQQSAARVGVPKKANKIAVFDNVNVRKDYVHIDGVRHPGDDVVIDYASNDYVDQYRDLKLIYKKYVGEELLNPFKNYTDMEIKYPIPIIDLRFQRDHSSYKKFQLSE